MMLLPRRGGYLSQQMSCRPYRSDAMGGEQKRHDGGSERILAVSEADDALSQLRKARWIEGLVLYEASSGGLPRHDTAGIARPEMPIPAMDVHGLSGPLSRLPQARLTLSRVAQRTLHFGKEMRWALMACGTRESASAVCGVFPCW